jgi:hypothetical protein
MRQGGKSLSQIAEAVGLVPARVKTILDAFTFPEPGESERPVAATPPLLLTLAEQRTRDAVGLPSVGKTHHPPAYAPATPPLLATLEEQCADATEVEAVPPAHRRRALRMSHLA